MSRIGVRAACPSLQSGVEEERWQAKLFSSQGALTGIGRATAIAFAKQGASVVVSGRREEEGRTGLQIELRGLGSPEAEFIKADVRHEEDVRNLVDKTVARFEHLDVAVKQRGHRRPTGSDCRSDS